MNAVVLVEGWYEGGIDGARTQLEQFWRRVSFTGSLSGLQQELFGQLFADKGYIAHWLDFDTGPARPSTHHYP